MKINSYQKKKNSLYRVVFDQGQSLDLYEEVILKYELLLHKEIDPKLFDELLACQQEWDVYYVALKYLRVRPRSYQEVYRLLKTRQYPEELITLALNKLTEQGYINDLNYAKSFLNDQLLTTSRGPVKISYELEKKGISKEIIAQVLTEYSLPLQQEKITKIINRMIASNRNKGSALLKRKILMELVHQGFDQATVEQAIDNTSFPEDQAIYQKEYDKLYRKLSGKYDGEELKRRISQKLYQKGFHYED